ncbi:succinylglutamate desuccinylase/aspartoacylase domain-containing protein [Alkalimarinus sediminis]|uniref:Succinylglutamate desuccinylase/aspartoacylase family protein n=1 Tax=Alkalimarinus sediminis TaxID=1632866 RepID=A0A9E8HGI8_9ALTE|nr:succinylglutamate desuccinylase/aspartoacylase family protein [Alkalimarinus sediminis]UZW73795.1 succinylglutamate desuccinylase/aspartoacylase family protein [Alkalimarinus sediminis]
MLNIIHDPESASLGATVEAFLNRLSGPAAIFVKGKDRSRTRVICTLLHGNEPSGVQAIHQYLSNGITPAVNALFIIGSVQAALTPPLFSHRTLPGKRDLNRCFKPPFEDEQGETAGAILQLIHSVKPEALIDLHNTSGSGPAFGVSINGDTDHLALTSLFTNDLIVTDLRLGAIMELSEREVPTVTIECGGASDTSAKFVAQEGISRYLAAESIHAEPGLDYRVNIFRNPIRLELQPGKHAAYSDTPQPNADITLPKNAERLNYGMVPHEEPLAFLGSEGLEVLTAKDHLGSERLNEFFECREGQLFCKHPIKLFMVTTNAEIAASDCLFYFIGCAD